MNLLYFVLAGFALFFALKLGLRFVKALIGKMSVNHEVMQWFPLIEVALWVAYAYWGSYVLFGKIRYYDYLILAMSVLLLFGISWFFFRDYFAGMMVRSEYRLRPGSQVKTPIAEGLVTRLGTRFLELENDKGEKVKLPYSLLSKHWLSLPADQDQGLSNHMILPIAEGTDVGSLKKAIETAMMGMPWIVGVPPSAKLKADKQGRQVIDIRYDLFMEEHAVLVEQKIRELAGAYGSGETPKV